MNDENPKPDQTGQAIAGGPNGQLAALREAIKRRGVPSRREEAVLAGPTGKAPMCPGCLAAMAAKWEEEDRRIEEQWERLREAGRGRRSSFRRVRQWVLDNLHCEPEEIDGQTVPSLTAVDWLEHAQCGVFEDDFWLDFDPDGPEGFADDELPQGSSDAR